MNYLKIDSVDTKLIVTGNNRPGMPSPGRFPEPEHPSCRHFGAHCGQSATTRISIISVSFFDYTHHKKIVIISAGEYHFTDEDMIIQTVLGSCIAVILYSDVNHLVGMNHFMLPRDPVHGVVSKAKYGFYGVHAVDLLFAEFVKRGVAIGNLKAMVYGGGNVHDIPDKNNVADNNIAFIVDFLKTENISISAHDMGGRYGRKIQFFTRSKKVIVREVPRIDIDKLKQTEKELKENFEALLGKPPDITLF
jgi:chemotaxis protein CheD